MATWAQDPAYTYGSEWTYRDGIEVLDPQNRREAQARVLREQVLIFKPGLGWHTGKRRAKTTPLPLLSCLQKDLHSLLGGSGIKVGPSLPLWQGNQGTSNPYPVPAPWNPNIPVVF